MANCKQVHRYLDLIDYVETGVIPSHIESHLSICKNCQKYQVEMQQLIFILRNQQRMAIPIDFDTNLQRRIRLASSITKSITKNGKYVWFSWIPTPALVSLATIIVISVVYVGNSSWRFVDMTNTKIQEKSLPAVAKIIVPDQIFGTAKSIEEVSTKADSLNIEEKFVKVTRSQRLTATNLFKSSTATKIQPNTSSDDVVLLLQDSSDVEHLVTVPSIIYGAQPIINTNSQPADTVDTSNQHIF